MDGRSSTAEPKHSYPSAPWPHLVSTAPASRTEAVAKPAAEASSPLFATHLELLPILFPHQSIYQAQLLNYNKLISVGRGGGIGGGGGGGGLQTSPLPPVLSASNHNIHTHSHSHATTHTHSHSGPRSRSSSKVSNKDVPAAKSAGHHQNGHGNRGPKNTEKAERVLIAGGKESSMPTSKMPPKQADLAHPLPSRPVRTSHQQQSSRQPTQASSVPSTPHQHARNFSFESREPSPNATQNHSPRSTYSDPNGNLTSLRPLPPRLGGCVFETALVRGRRRMPYSLGGDRLEAIDPIKIKSKLSEDEDRKLTTDMRELYDRLKPTEKVQGNREKMVGKLERIFNQEWPGHNIKVHLFGSSGNKLCSDDSDVDICITTDWKELENVCVIAELLAKRGMDNVVCVSSAKVPIVKIWDPELGLACDMNVNNTLALENTRMVLTYVEIDERVRPLAMIIKHWTRRRIINDAAFGGTLSSYTWMCMIIAFLQLRSPPLLPALHQYPHKKSNKTEFADDLTKLGGFGDKNQESLGQLLFHFFRFYAYEFEYDKWALSIRLGKTITKTEKKWHLALNNMLCVEEPFNTIRNLGNTADDTSFRGLHQELRRAFDLIAEAKLDECCEQFVFPKEEERVWQKPAPAPRPVLVRSSSQQHSNRGGRGNYRGNRGHRGSNRRASSSVAYENNPAHVQPSLQPTMAQDPTAQWYQAQQAVQYPYVTDGSFMNSTLMTAAALQYDPNIARFQIFTQSQQYAQQQALANIQRMSGSASATGQPTDRSRAGSFDQPPLSAPLRPEFAYVYPQFHMPSPYYHQQAGGFTTYPSSPATAAGAPEFRRSLHRNTVTGDSGVSSGSAGLRSQSQPASRSPMPTTTTQGGVPGYPGTGGQATAVAAVAATNGISINVNGAAAGLDINGASDADGLPSLVTRPVNGMPISFIPSDDVLDTDYDEAARSMSTLSVSDSPPLQQEENGTRYVGYYVSDGTSPVKKTLPNGIPSFGDLGQSIQARRRLSTDQSPQSILDRRMRRTSRSPSPLGHARAFSVGTGSTPASASSLASSTTFPQGQTSGGSGSGSGGKLTVDARPVVVNGSISCAKPASSTPSSRHPSASESISSETSSVDTPRNPLNPLHIIQGFGSNGYMSDKSPMEASLSAPDRPVVVNGSNAPSLAGALSVVSATPAAVAPGPTHTAADVKSFNQRIAAMSNFQPSSVFQRLPPPTEPMSAYPLPRTVMRYHQQNGVIAPLDLAIADHTILPDFQHLSPVYETRTPSPTAVRKFDGPPGQAFSAGSERPAPLSVVSSFSKNFQPMEAARTTVKTPANVDASVSPKQSFAGSPPQVMARINGHPAKDAAQTRLPPRIDTGASPSGWQKPKGRKKPNDLKHLPNGSWQSEQLPKNEADRRGG